MKKQFLLLLVMLSLYEWGYAQAPSAIAYQAVVRNASGLIMANQAVKLRFTIHDSIATGNTVYQETHTLITNAQGLVVTNIGQGASTIGSFSSINWGKSNKYVQTALDVNNNNTFTDLGTTQFLSVPYAMHANNGMPNSTQKGDMLFYNGDEWVKLSAGGYGQALVMCDSIPSWGGCVPKVTTSELSAITYTTLTASGIVTAEGGFPVTSRGICWGTSSNPTVELSTKSIEGAGLGGFASNITGLLPNSTYHLRAYATNSIGTGYGSDVEFVTNALMLPTVSSNEPYNISYTTASAGGYVSADGGASVTARGFCWSSIPNPTVALATKTVDGNGTGGFVSTIVGLNPNSTYYLRAYASNSVGTSYGEEYSFSTLGLTTPTVSTSDASAITTNSAFCGGNITDDGGAQITERGICWSTNPNPTVNLPTKTLEGTGSGAFVSSITGLSTNRTYYVRAYATNAFGVSYGNEITFTTWSEPQSTGKVVISQIYGGGGGSSATYNSDFIELHNISSVPQDVSGFKLAYGSSNGFLGSAANNRFTFPSNTIIPAGGYLLVADSGLAGGLAGLPVIKDLYFRIAMSATKGKIVLGTSSLIDSASLASQPEGAVLDFVGYGTANEYEGAPTASLTNLTAAIRNNNGCNDSNNNASDFSIATPYPRNSSSPVFLCDSVACPTQVNNLLGDYLNTDDDFGGNTYGPYVTSISNIVVTSSTTGTITVNNIFDYGWAPIVFNLDWSNQSNPIVSLNQQENIALGSTVGLDDTYQVMVRAFNGENGTFSSTSCSSAQTVQLKMQVGAKNASGSELWSPSLYIVNLAR